MKKCKLKKYGLLWWMREFAFVIICILIILILALRPYFTETEKVAAVSRADERQPLVMREYDIPLPVELQYYTQGVCLDYDIDPALVFAIMYVESAYQLDAINGDCLGLMQISEKWHTERMQELGGSNLYDPYANILTAVDYLAELLAQDNSLEWALMTYNGLDEDVKNQLLDDGQVSDYVYKVYKKWGELQNENE